MRNKKFYFLKGARAFLCGRRIACYRDPYKHWQHKASADGDRAMRVYLFGKVNASWDDMRELQDAISFRSDRLQVIDRLMAAFEACEDCGQLKASLLLDFRAETGGAYEH